MILNTAKTLLRACFLDVKYRYNRAIIWPFSSAAGRRHIPAHDDHERLIENIAAYPVTPWNEAYNEHVSAIQTTSECISGIFELGDEDASR